MKTFLTPCFIRTTSDEQKKRIIEQLEKMGYKNYRNTFQSTDFNWIYTTIDGFYVPYRVSNIDNSWHNCGTNEDLFLALAAMNDIDDYRQLFKVYDIFEPKIVEWFLCEEQSMEEYLNYAKAGLCYADKATKEEIINHFENK